MQSQGFHKEDVGGYRHNITQPLAHASGLYRRRVSNATLKGGDSGVIDDAVCRVTVAASSIGTYIALGSNIHWDCDWEDAEVKRYTRYDIHAHARTHTHTRSLAHPLAPAAKG